MRPIRKALRRPPVPAAAPQRAASRWGVSTRGFAWRFANQPFVLVDRRSVYSPMLSGVSWQAERVSLDNIERIEVLHGSAGSIWASNAANGAISIIGKRADATQTGAGVKSADRR